MLQMASGILIPFLKDHHLSSLHTIHWQVALPQWCYHYAKQTHNSKTKQTAAYARAAEEICTTPIHANTKRCIITLSAAALQPDILSSITYLNYVQTIWQTA